MAKRRAKKQAAMVTSPDRAKSPGARDTPDVIKHLPVAWGLIHLDLDGRWGWRKLDEAHVDELHRELVKLEGKTLDKLLRSKEIKEIPTAHMRREAKERLSKLGLEERDALWELRLPGKRRAWGLMEGSIFHFLWWDPDETACGPPDRGERRR
jgi:hypothetical protein